MDEERKILTVAELIDVLKQYDPTEFVKLDSTCCGCRGAVFEVVKEEWHIGEVCIRG